MNAIAISNNDMVCLHWHFSREISLTTSWRGSAEARHWRMLARGLPLNETVKRSAAGGAAGKEAT